MTPRTHRRPRLLALTLALTAGLTLAGAAATAAPAAASAPTDANDFSFDSFTVDYELNRAADGHATLRTVETIVADFPAEDQNRGIVRAIPNEYRGADLDVSVVGVTDESGTPVPYETSSQDGFTELALGTDDFVHGRTTYVLEYTQRDVIGGFADTGADEFYWDVNGTGWGQEFGSLTARLHLDAALAEAKGLPYDARGVIVTAVEAGSPADQMGLRVDDLLISLNDVTMDTAKTFADTASKRTRTWQVILQRGGQVLRSIVGG